jgi:tetratricopeptide (TPR) repeat protein
MTLLLLLMLAPDPALAQERSPAALSEEAQALAKAKEYDKAERLWRRALELEADYYPALFNLAYLYFSRQNFAGAEPLLSRAARVEPKDFNTRYLLGAALAALGRREEGLRQWRAALELRPNDLRLLQVVSVEYSKGRYFNEAAAAARRALSLAGKDQNLYFLTIKAYQDAGDYTAALEIARKAVELFPGSARANFEYAFHLQKLGRVEECLPHLKKAMEVDPTYEEPFFFYGDLLIKQGQYAEAIAPLEKAIANRADYTPARVSLARALIGLDRLKEAVAALEQAIRLDAMHPQPHLLLSQIYFRMGDEEGARREKEISLRLRRENPTILEAVQGRPFPK